LLKQINFSRKKSIDLVFLGTAKSIVAYNLYKSLGYEDFDPQTVGFKRIKNKNKKTGLTVVPYRKSMKSSKRCNVGRRQKFLVASPPKIF